MEPGEGQTAGAVPPFADRSAAGASLAAALARFHGADALILGIPTGGVPVAAEVALRLGAELDVVIARKLGAPDEPELALGAVTALGAIFIDKAIVANHGVSEEQLAAIIARETAEAGARETRYRGGRPQPRITQRTVIVVDDGLATGATLRAALRAVRAQGPARLVAAVPIGSVDAPADLQGDADEIVCLVTPDPFEAVSVHYEDFDAVSGESIQNSLSDAMAGWERAAGGRRRRGTRTREAEGDPDA
jgi:predicted phosphoribosyltransferase